MGSYRCGILESHTLNNETSDALGAPDGSFVRNIDDGVNAAQRHSLRFALRGREAHTVRDVGDGIAVRVNLERIPASLSREMTGNRKHPA
jgi:hypothetical protein